MGDTVDKLDVLVKPRPTVEIGITVILFGEILWTVWFIWIGWGRSIWVWTGGGGEINSTLMFGWVCWPFVWRIVCICWICWPVWIVWIVWFGWTIGWTIGWTAGWIVWISWVVWFGWIIWSAEVFCCIVCTCCPDVLVWAPFRFNWDCKLLCVRVWLDLFMASNALISSRICCCSFPCACETGIVIVLIVVEGEIGLGKETEAIDDEEGIVIRGVAICAGLIVFYCKS